MIATCPAWRRECCTRSSRRRRSTVSRKTEASSKEIATARIGDGFVSGIRIIQYSKEGLGAMVEEAVEEMVDVDVVILTEGVDVVVLTEDVDVVILTEDADAVTSKVDVDVVAIVGDAVAIAVDVAAIVVTVADVAVVVVAAESIEVEDLAVGKS